MQTFANIDATKRLCQGGPDDRHFILKRFLYRYPRRTFVNFSISDALANAVRRLTNAVRSAMSAPSESKRGSRSAMSLMETRQHQDFVGKLSSGCKRQPLVHRSAFIDFELAETKPPDALHRHAVKLKRLIIGEQEMIEHKSSGGAASGTKTERRYMPAPISSILASMRAPPNNTLTTE